MPSLMLGETALGAGATPTAWEQTILREGEWAHPKAPGGRLKIDGALLAEMKRNFDAGVGLADREIPFHVGHTEHLDDRAAAWASVDVRDDPERPGRKRMVALAHFTTDEDAARVKGGQHRYVSPRIDFGYEDKESGKTHGAVIRNVALTNYPYLKRMGAGRVVNLSELAEAEGDTGGGPGVTLAAVPKGSAPQAPGEPWADGGPMAGEPNPDGLPDGYDLQSLPRQCMACARLGNDCPFSAPDRDDDLELKQAAAGSGNCPQYAEADGQTPGQGGGADAANASPALNRTAVRGTTARMSETARMTETATVPRPKPRQTTMTPEHIKRLQERVAAADKEKTDAFFVTLAETHALPADALTAVRKALDAGHRASVQLSEAVAASTVTLSETDGAVVPPAFASVDLSESVVMTRGEFLAAIEAAASAPRVELAEGQTAPVGGRPGDKREVSLAEQIEAATPEEAVAIVRALGGKVAQAK